MSASATQRLCMFVAGTILGTMLMTWEADLSHFAGLGFFVANLLLGILPWEAQ